jgi:hypothetical protein
MSRETLIKAQIKKDDEYYTRLEDIQFHLDHFNFSNLVIGCPADSEQSQFVNYFTNFNKPKKLLYWQDIFDEEKLNQCDLVITNPPFSIKKDFIRLLDRLNKQYILVLPLTIKFENLKKVVENRNVTNFIRPDGSIAKVGSAFFTNSLYYILSSYIPKLENTIFTKQTTGLNIVSSIKDLGKDYNTIPNLVIPLTAYFRLKEYGLILDSNYYFVGKDMQYYYQRNHHKDFYIKFPELNTSNFTKAILNFNKDLLNKDYYFTSRQEMVHF